MLRWNTLAFLGLASSLGACGDNGTGPSDGPLNDATGALLLESIALGSRHSCGLTPEGKAYCWGKNESGRLGDGTTTNRSSPVAVAGDLTFEVLEAGGAHTCGITSDDATYCWGWNDQGRLGDGTTADRTVPARVAGDPKFVTLSLGAGYSCGLTAAGDTYCWGSNRWGQFGDDKVVVGGACALREPAHPLDVVPRPYCTSPVPAALGLTPSTLGSGGGHTCGLALDGRVYCWGLNAWGQVGDSTTTDRFTPVPVASDLRYDDLSAGGSYACALGAEGALDCWGPLPTQYMNGGSPAPGESIFGPTIPQPVAPELRFQSVAVGADVACGITDDGAAHCWGDHLHGALGDGTMRDRNNPNDRPRMAPQAVLGGHKFRIVAAAAYRACGLTAEGVAYCWGLNDFGQLGDGTTRDRSEPVVVRAAS